MPVLLAPCGAARLIRPHGEQLVARAAAKAGSLYVVPHMGGTLAAQIAPEGGPLWYQIYQVGGREVAEAALRRAWDAGYRTLVVTVDNPGTLRERDARNGLGPLLSGERRQALPYLGQLLARPHWLAGFLRDGRPTDAPNAQLDGRAMRPLDIMRAAGRPDFTFRWSDFQWLRAAWPGPMIAKGILTAEDARRALDCGVTGLIVSNHGGRSVDGLAATLPTLPEIVRAAPDTVPVLLDGGVRNGGDVIKALCLGARAVLIGRPYLFALAAGDDGVPRLLQLLEADLRQHLAALGCASIADLSSELVRLPAGQG